LDILFLSTAEPAHKGSPDDSKSASRHRPRRRRRRVPGCDFSDRERFVLRGRKTFLAALLYHHFSQSNQSLFTPSQVTR
jgi:hypothetical protein